MLFIREKVIFVLVIFGFVLAANGLTPEQEMLKSMLYPRIRQIITPSTNDSSNTTSPVVSRQCKDAVKNLLLYHRDLLGKYIDAAGKPGSGFEDGNTAMLGSYSECIIIPQAHYCLADIFVNSSSKFPLTIKWGLCAPKECSDMDLAHGLEAIISMIPQLKKILEVTGLKQLPPLPRAVNCAAPSKFTPGVVATLTLCGVLLFLCLIGTVLEIAQTYLSPKGAGKRVRSNYQKIGAEEGQDTAANSDSNHGYNSLSDSGAVNRSNDERVPLLLKEPEKQNIILAILLCFSLIRNTNRIMDTNVAAGAITSLNGMRVLSMWWVILGHTFIWMIMNFNVTNLVESFGIMRRFTFQALLNAFFSVDSFFFLSGLLVSYLSLRQMEKRKGLPLFKFYFHRFWRLTPSYMFVLLFYAKLNGFLGKGPLWFSQQTNPPCDKYWWTNLLYINNFHPDGLQEECMGWSWYLANDMQFYILSPIFLYAIYKFRFFGYLGSVGTFFAAHFLTTGLLIGLYNMNSTMIGGGNGQLTPPGQGKYNFGDTIYIKPWSRIGPYLVGISLGYLLHVQKERPKRTWLMILIATVGWSVAITLGILVVYGPYSVSKEGGSPFNTAENVAYGTFSRTAWGLALAWVIYACHMGFGGLVNSILSARFWIPLSRLTYSAYLLHPIVLFAFFNSNETNIAYSDVAISFYFVGGMVLSYAAAYILAVCVEFPMMQLEKVMFKSRDRDR